MLDLEKKLECFLLIHEILLLLLTFFMDFLNILLRKKNKLEKLLLLLLYYHLGYTCINILHGRLLVCLGKKIIAFLFKKKSSILYTQKPIDSNKKNIELSQPGESNSNDPSQGMLDEGSIVTVRTLLKGLYEKACQQKLWGLVRHTAGMLGKRVEDLAKAVTDLLVRQKQVTVGMPPNNEFTITGMY